MRVLVLGGSGFLGLHLTLAAWAAGYEVWWLNRARTPPPLPFEVPTLRADRDDPASLTRVLATHRIEALVDASGYRPEQVEPVVAAVTGRVLRYVFLSSVAVYGPPVRAGAAMRREDEAGGRVTPYGEAKRACEAVLLDAHRTRGLPATVLRLAPVFGPWDWKCRELAYLRRVRALPAVPLPEGGRRLVHLLDARHFAATVVRLLGNSGGVGGTYNLATGEPVTLRRYVTTLATALGPVPDVVAVPPDRWAALPLEERRRWPYAKPYDQAYDVSRIRELTHDQGDLDAGLRETARWYERVGDGWCARRAAEIGATHAPEVGLYTIAPADEELAADRRLLESLDLRQHAPGRVRDGGERG